MKECSEQEWSNVDWFHIFRYRKNSITYYIGYHWKYLLWLDPALLKGYSKIQKSRVILPEFGDTPSNAEGTICNAGAQIWDSWIARMCPVYFSICLAS